MAPSESAEQARQVTARPPSRGSLISTLILILLGLVAGYFGATSVRVLHAAAGDELRPADAIIVFGAAEYAGRPSPVLRARLDHAYNLFELGLAPIVIVTGGAGADPKFSEGGVGRDYLMGRGVPEVNLIAETQSNDTAESAARVSTIMRRNDLHTAIAVSDAYHMFRVKKLLERNGIEAIGSPRPDSIPRTRWARIEGALREAFSYSLAKMHIR